MKVVYEHYRRNEEGDLARYYTGGNKKPRWTPAPRGGATVCSILTDDGKRVSRGLAICSDKDAFCYRIGRAISYGRALKMAREDAQ